MGQTPPEDPLASAVYVDACFLVTVADAARSYACFEKDEAGPSWRFARARLFEPGQAPALMKSLRRALSGRSGSRVAVLRYAGEADPRAGFEGDLVVTPSARSNLNGEAAGGVLASRRALLLSRLSAPDAADCLKAGEAPVPDGPGTISHNPCCRGLAPIVAKEACGRPFGGYAGVCAACGDGRCDPAIEDSCNCPADCGAPKSP